MFFAFPKLFFRSKSNNEKGGKKAKFTRLDIYLPEREGFRGSNFDRFILGLCSIGNVN